MDGRPPPQPPPHGNNSKSSGLPPGNYDIFIIPPHSSGSGFLYLPSLAPHRNSFLAGVACTLLLVSVWVIVIPAVKQWTSTVVQSGGMGVLVLVFGVGVLGWAYGKTQMEGAKAGASNDTDASDGHARGGFGTSSANSNSRPNPFSGTAPPPPKSSWSRPTPGPGAAGWEKAREETRKREQERRQKDEAAKKARETAEKDKWEKMRAREKEAREKGAREKVVQDRMRREREAKEKAEKAEKAELAEKVEKERAAKEERAAREAYEEKLRNPAAAAASSAGRKYQKPTAQSFAGDDEYSYRPYDDPKDSSQSSIFSQSSIHTAPSTAPSSAPPKGPPGSRVSYRTKDPDKIVIKAVYLFSDASAKPVAQLVAGVGNVTDGLILKMTTEGMFIDDDVRGVGQREWDVKAWTMKLVEVFCPSFIERIAPAPARYANSPQKKDPVQRFLGNMSPHKTGLNAEETDLVLEDLLRTCKSKCGMNHQSNSGSIQNGDFKGRHVLRASVRDVEGKKYVFIIPTEEAWKVAVGLQRLRRGTQVRSLGTSGLPASDTRMILNSLGWV